MTKIFPPLRSAVSSTPGLLMGLAFLVTWIEPEAIGENMVSYFSVIMMLEFLTIHSAAFMGWALIGGKNAFNKTVIVLGLGAFYSIFVYIFSPPGEWWPLGAFWLLVLHRLATGLFGKQSDQNKRKHMTVAWGWSVFWYVISVVFAVMLPLPAFGWTADTVATLTATGPMLWFEDPQSLFAAGWLYFTAVGLFEFFGGRLTEKFSDPDRTLRRNP